MTDNELSGLEDEFGEVASMLRSGLPAAPTESPGGDVWRAIADQLDLSPEARPFPGEVPAIPESFEQSPPEGAVLGDAPAAPSSGLSAVYSQRQLRPLGGKAPRPLRKRTPRGLPILVGVAAAAVLSVPIFRALRSSDAVFHADLAAVGELAGSGEAELYKRTLGIDATLEGAPEGSFYEVWLLDLEGDEVAALRSLGEFDPLTSFEVPPDIDLTAFDVVDISLEPDDDNPGHSGKSLLRGTLTEVQDAATRTE